MIRCRFLAMLSCLAVVLSWGAPSLLLAQGKSGQEAVAREPEPKEALPAEPKAAQIDWQEIAKNLTFLAQFDANYSLSDRKGADTLSGFGLSTVMAPGYRINENAVLLLIYSGRYYKKREFYSDLIGPRERTELQSHTFTPMYNYDFGKGFRYSVTPSLFYTKTYNKDVAGGGWGDGLYNYNDMGLGVDFKMRRLGFGGADGFMKLGLQYYDREYPNYYSLLDLATGIGVEEDERDYRGILFRAGYSWHNPAGYAWSADYFLLLKDLEDKKVVDSSGVLTSEEQRDHLHGITCRGEYIPTFVLGLKMEMILNVNFNRSNQNYYDGRGTISLADDVFMEGFYDYSTFGITPAVSYRLPAIPLTPSLSYSYQKTGYSGRRAQFRDGSYKDEEQEETQQEVNVGLHYEVHARMSLYARWQHLTVASNNDDESIYSYNHEVDTYYAGFAYRF